MTVLEQTDKWWSGEYEGKVLMMSCMVWSTVYVCMSVCLSVTGWLVPQDLRSGVGSRRAGERGTGHVSCACDQYMLD